MAHSATLRALVVLSGRQQGGPVRFLERWFAHSARICFQVIALGAGPGAARLAAGGWNPEVWPDTRLRIAWGLAPLVARLVARARCADLVVANGAREHVVAGLAAALSHRPAIWCAHNPWRPTLPLNCVARVVPTAAIVAASQAAVQRLDPALRARARRVPFGVDIPPALNELDECAMRWRATLPAHDALMVVLGTLAPEKGPHVALDAAAGLARSHPATLLVFAGPPGPPGYAPALRARAAALGIAERVRWLGPVAEPLALLRAADVVLQPSLAPETFGFAAAEAAAVGRPVVAAASGALREIVVHGRTGLLVPSGDALALAAAIGLLLDAPALRERLGAAARARAARCYDARRMAVALDALAEEVVGAWR